MFAQKGMRHEGEGRKWETRGMLRALTERQGRRGWRQTGWGDLKNLKKGPLEKISYSHLNLLLKLPTQLLSSRAKGYYKSGLTSWLVWVIHALQFGRQKVMWGSWAFFLSESDRIQPSVFSAAENMKLQVQQIHQLSLTISVLQLLQMWIPIRYDTHVFHVHLELWICKSSCVHVCRLGPPLASIRPGRGPSALEASCTPQHQELATHLSAFVPVSSYSQPASLRHTCSSTL